MLSYTCQGAGRQRGRRPRGGRPRHNILVPPAGYTLCGFLRRHCYNSRIRPLIKEYDYHGGNPPHRRVGEYLGFVKNKYLPYLELDVSREISPELAERGQIKKALIELSDPGNRLPQDVAREASRIFNLFEQRAWSATALSQTARPTTGASSTYPPSDHPIWGDQGIMHGVLPDRGAGGNRTYKLDGRFSPRSARAYGHNGLRPGDWFAMQKCAIFRGAHAQPLHGIAGDKDRGAHSIVLSGGRYSEVNRDEGDVIYYSAQGASKRDASRHAGALGNQALVASHATGRPVRVLRSSKASRRWAPPCGIRYDGLYRVVGTERRLNKSGGIYMRFKLQREPGQASLEEIMRVSPTAQQQADCERIKYEY